MARQPAIEVRIPGVMPEDIPLATLVELLQAMEQAISGAIPDDEKPVIGLVGIARGSTTFRFAKRSHVATAHMEIAAAVKKGDVSTLSERSRTGTMRIAQIAKRSNFSVEFRPTRKGARRALATITPDTDLTERTPPRLGGMTTIYGRVERVGGTDPKVNLRLSHGDLLACSVSEDLARELGRRLYTWVGVNGSAEWNQNDLSIATFKIANITDYTDVPLAEALTDMADLAHHWAGVDVSAEAARIRYGDDDDDDGTNQGGRH